MKKFWIGCLLLLTAACSRGEKPLRVAATAVPHAELLEIVKEKGLDLDILVVDDYNIPNRMLHEKKIDANFFQHEPFLKEQIETHGYALLPLARIHLEPMGLYSCKWRTLKDLPDNAKVAIPSDPTNEGRALRLLEKEGLISLREEAGLSATTMDITRNPKKLKVLEVDAPFLPRACEDVDLALIPSNFALQGGLSPTEDAIALESTDSPYTNVVVIREEDLDDPRLQELAKLLTSDEMRQYLQERYKGSISPAF